MRLDNGQECAAAVVGAAPLAKHLGIAKRSSERWLAGKCELADQRKVAAAVAACVIEIDPTINATFDLGEVAGDETFCAVLPSAGRCCSFSLPHQSTCSRASRVCAQRLARQAFRRIRYAIGGATGSVPAKSSPSARLSPSLPGSAGPHGRG
jgi:hypothetical protein